MAVYTPLSNNASKISPSSKLEDISLDRLEKVFAVNAIGNILCAKYAIKYLLKNHGYNGGKIINISSVASRIVSANEYIDYGLY